MLRECPVISSLWAQKRRPQHGHRKLPGGDDTFVLFLFFTFSCVPLKKFKWNLHSIFFKKPNSNIKVKFSVLSSLALPQSWNNTDYFCYLINKLYTVILGFGQWKKRNLAILLYLPPSLSPLTSVFLLLILFLHCQVFY